MYLGENVIINRVYLKFFSI